MTGTVMTDNAPAKCSPLAHWMGRFIIAISGWKVKGRLPLEKKMIVLGAPHTSSWDLLFLLAAAFYLGARVHWLGKNSLFLPGVGAVLRYFGGIPVIRGEKLDTVGQLADRISKMDKITLIIAPEGTRSSSDHWKSGFYHLAMKSGIPVVCGYLDYARKEAGLGLCLYLSGNIRQDMDLIRAQYESVTACYPDQKGNAWISEESG